MNEIIIESSKSSYNNKLRRIKNRIVKDKWLILLCFPGLFCVLLFHYGPMYGILIAFMKNYNPRINFFENEFAGLYQFIRFIKDPMFFRIFRNTLLLGIYSLLWSFPAPIILALLLNEVKNAKFKKTIQTITYLPYFVSTVVIIGIFKSLAALDTGIFNIILKNLGMDQIIFFAEPEWFRTLYISSGIWAGIGFGAIIYLAALSGIDEALYEAAKIDGANRWHCLRFITVPSIMPTIVILFILAVGNVLGSDFTKIYLMYSPSTYETADVFTTYVYRQGIEGANYSYSTAVGLFRSVISVFFLIVANTVSRKVSENSLW